MLFPYSLGWSQTQAIPSLLRVSWSCFDATQLSQGNLPSPCVQSTCLGVPTECSPYARCQVHCSEQIGVDTCPQVACNQRTSRLKATTLSLKVFGAFWPFWGSPSVIPFLQVKGFVDILYILQNSFHNLSFFFRESCIPFHCHFGLPLSCMVCSLRLS